MVATFSIASATPAWPAPDSITDIGSRAQTTVPSWVFPLNPPAASATPRFDQVKPLHVPGSRATYTEAYLNDRFAAPDWFPESHSEMPAIVAKGRRPAVNACGYCHTSGGQGRPENASLAGLPAAYIFNSVRSGGFASSRAIAYRDHMLLVGYMSAFPTAVMSPSGRDQWNSLLTRHGTRRATIKWSKSLTCPGEV
jgi:mono/diheme cytochrome c family protein